MFLIDPNVLKLGKYQWDLLCEVFYGFEAKNIMAFIETNICEHYTCKAKVKSWRDLK